MSRTTHTLRSGFRGAIASLLLIVLACAMVWSALELSLAFEQRMALGGLGTSMLFFFAALYSHRPRQYLLTWSLWTGMVICILGAIYYTVQVIVNSL